MNIKYMTLFSLIFVTGINSMSPVDQYEYTRQELQNCNNRCHDCRDQQAAFDKARERLERPFNEIIEKTKESHKMLNELYPIYSQPVDEQRATYKKYLEKEKGNKFNAARHYGASRIKEVIYLDQFTDVDRFCNRELPIDQQMIEEVKWALEWALKERRYFNRILYHKYMSRFFRPENSKKIDLVAVEMRKEIDQLQTKDTI